jgi:hypothetical protein
MFDSPFDFLTLVIAVVALVVARKAFAVLIAATLIVAWRAPAATGAVAAAAVLVFIVFAEWAVRANTNLLVLPGGPLPGIGSNPIGESVTLHLVAAAVFAAGFGIAGFLTQGRSTKAIIPVVCDLCAACAPDRALCSHRPSGPLDSLRDRGRDPGRSLRRRDELLSRRENRPGLMIATALFATATLATLAPTPAAPSRDQAARTVLRHLRTSRLNAIWLSSAHTDLAPDRHLLHRIAQLVTVPTAARRAPSPACESRTFRQNTRKRATRSSDAAPARFRISGLPPWAPIGAARAS